MAYLALVVVYVVAALTAFAGFWLTAVLFVSDDNDATGTMTALLRGVAGRGPILIAVGVGLGLIGNVAANHLPPAPAGNLVAPSHPSDPCDLNDGLFGLCGAGQLR
ncbi:hypothetical protein A5647_18980 [Mycobacterium sp. 1100029.7]|nr:hypothetical protein A5647_18980 [Mycobacterium sp. 1100029.7]